MNAIPSPLSLVPGQVAQVPIAQLCCDPNQPRSEFDQAALEALATDIAARGIDHPLLVRADGVIKDGERRWRAAKIAKLKTVPCLLAPASLVPDGGVAWLLDQAANNDHAEKLGPLDWARFLKKLTTEYNVAVKDVPALLAARGITMSRPYVSNLIRLVELPDWAQEKIKASTLSAAHGKVILIAKDSPKALKEVQRQIDDWQQCDYNGPLTTGDLHNLMVDALSETHPMLDSTVGEDAPKFDIKTCEGCPNRRVVSEKGYQDHLFCFDEPCFQKKQTAVSVKAAGAKTNAVAGQRVVTKLNPREAARRRQERVRHIAHERAITKIVEKTSGGLGTLDRRLIAKTYVYEIWHERLKEICKRRAWEPKKQQHGGKNYRLAAANAIDKMDDAALGGFLMECAVRGHSQTRDADNNLQETAKRYRIDLKALEKTVSAELKAKPVEKKNTKPKKPGSKKAANKKRPPVKKRAKKKK